MSRIFAAFLLIAVLAIGGSAVAATAYQAGLTTAVAQIPAGSATVVAPVVIPAYGYGFGHPGFGFLGFLGTIFFLILVFGLLRAIFGRGRGHGHGWGPGGPGGPGGAVSHGGPGGPCGPDGQNPWQARANQRFEAWHREAHGGPTGDPIDGPPAPTAPTDASGVNDASGGAASASPA